ncbi:MAG: UbiD family decarboxylase [Kiritimatiellae bacterium]|nr:UbiD family decarboxylase [Kiritimatiellia bacterium]
MLAPRDLREFVSRLEADGDLVRVQTEVDPNQEITVIQHHVLAGGGPALLFENVKGSPYRILANAYGTPARVEAALGRPARDIGAAVADAAEHLLPPSPAALWSQRRMIRSVLRSRCRTVTQGPVMAARTEPPDLEQLPCLTCWPKDGGAFFTLPLVRTHDPVTGTGNLGIYRLQRYDAHSTGMHWQIEKGGGFHFAQARARGEALPVSVFLGGPPVLTLAAIAPLPEGIDEYQLAAFLLGRPMRTIRRASGHRIPADAEFVLEGSVAPDERRREGPFGDHLGHYSHSADFPVFRVDRVLARSDAIYPATVVGKPPQEDYFIGEALQDLTIPLLRIIKPAVCNCWAFPETGFHPLAAVAVKVRYPHEALKHAFSILGESQLSLTKVLTVVDADVDVRDFKAVSRALWQHLDTEEGLHLVAPTAQDTLDFTGPAMNTGSRLILLATRGDGAPRRTAPPPPPPDHPPHPAIRGMTMLGDGVLMVQVHADADKAAVRDALQSHPGTRQYLFQVLVSEDVPLDDPRLMLWGWFTRFDPLVDLHPARRETAGNRLILHPPITIDATWKSGYRDPVEFDPQIRDRVASRWNEYAIPIPLPE